VPSKRPSTKTMLQQQQKRSIRASVSKSSSSHNALGSSRFTIVHGIALVILIVACAALGLYLSVMSSFRASQFSTTAAGASVHQKQDQDKAAVQQIHEEKKLLDVPETASAPHDVTKKETLILKTKIGDVKIVLRPDLSKGSVDYIHRLIKASAPDGSCPGCRLYRAEKPGILQGILRKDVDANTVRGSCPAEFEAVANDCPAWDKQCGCHGPVMTRGMVGWAAGTAGGQDFFIDNYPNPAKWWGTQHTGA
jgi:hypothetical protein